MAVASHVQSAFTFGKACRAHKQVASQERGAMVLPSYDVPLGVSAVSRSTVGRHISKSGE